jgi:hypothetical protein
MEKQEAILSALENNLITNKKMRKCDLGNVDQALPEWFKVQRNAGFPINGPILKIQGEKFAKRLGHENFTCNNGWLHRFKNWHNIVYAKVSAEVLSVDSKTVSEWLECQQGYSKEDIYNADETGVFYNMMPDSTFKFKGEKCVDGKMSKNHLTVLMCVNMTETDK